MAETTATSSCLATKNCSNLTDNESPFVPGFYAPRDTFPIVIAILIVAVNCWVIGLVVLNRNLRTVTNYILTSLAASDVCTGVIVIPLFLSCNIILETGYCTAEMVTTIFISVSTVLHILAMTIDRYICIIHALRYQGWVTKRRGVHVIALIWLISMFVALIQLSWFNFDEEVTDEYSDDVAKIMIIYDIFLFVVVIGIPVLFMGFSYGRILYEVHRQTKNIQKNSTPGWQETRKSTKQEWKVATIFLVMFVVFIVCWVPFYLLRLQQILEKDLLDIDDLTVAILYWLRLCSSLINPCLYILGKPDFRKAAGLKRKNQRRYNTDWVTRSSLMKSSSV